MSENWVPFTLAWDDNVPLDLSFLYKDEKPAGKRGFLSVKDGQFVFEDGREARFWGTCFNSGANFPTHAHAEMLARRLAKFGVNIMRTHQMDAEWATPNLFQFNRTEPKDHTRTLDPQSLDRLDYLIACLKNEGVYIYLDLLTYRQFRPGDGVDVVDGLPQAAKSYHYFDPRLIELQKEFNAALWTHLNPYTGLAYKDDPAIALTEIVNESDPFVQPPVLEPYRARLETSYRSWAEERNLPVNPQKVNFTKPDTQLARFLVEVMEDYYREMIGHLRGAGVKAPIAGTNWSINLAVTAAQRATDFMDTHMYWNFPLWEGHPDGTATRPMVAEADNLFRHTAFQSRLDRPLFLSEWDHAWPDEWRAESSLLYAAVAAFQGWGGVTIHTYRYSDWEPVPRLGGGASTINGITYRNHFDSFNDPAKFGLFYQAALLFRRGDVRRAEKTLALRAEDEPGWLLKSSGMVGIPNTGMAQATATVSELHRVGLVLPDEVGLQADLSIPLGERLVDPAAGEVLSDTGEMYRSWQKRYGWIDTPRTKVAYGFLGEAGPLALEGLALEVQTDFAVIALSSLSDEPLEGSESILLTAVGRCDNAGALYDPGHRKQLDPGHPPVMIEPIRARLRLKTGRPNLKALVISEHGELVTRLPVEYKDGNLSFEIGPQPAWNPSTMYYLIKV